MSLAERKILYQESVTNPISLELIDSEGTEKEEMAKEEEEKKAAEEGRGEEESSTTISSSTATSSTPNTHKQRFGGWG